MCSLRFRITASLFGVSLCAPISAQVTQVVSVGLGGAQANNYSLSASISADGRYVAFVSAATNLIPGGANGLENVFVYDRRAGTCEQVNVATGGAPGAGGGYYPSISPDGRYVSFSSSAANLAPGDTNGFQDVFVHDRQSGTTERVSVDSSGAQANNHSYNSSISADGRYVAFHSDATNLVAGDTNGFPDVFLRDRRSGTTERVSVATGGAQGDGYSEFPSISADGRYVAFFGGATNLVAGDTNGFSDVFVRDRQSGTTERVSVDSGGLQGNGECQGTSISSDGRYVAFPSLASNLVPNDANGTWDIFVRDRLAGTTERVSVDSGGAQGNGDSLESSISADGRYVTFESLASNLVLGDTNQVADVFVHDRQTGTTERVSVATGGAQGNDNSLYPAISADGRWAGFQSRASNLVAGDGNGFADVFIHDRFATGFTSLCDPGIGGVIACPCANPPGGTDRGCDNSAATGGAILSASGIAYLSIDSLVFTTSGERPTALSVLMQGNTLLAHGAVYGQGVRCVGGTTKRLFTKTASGGSITAPDFGAGDPTISARSAAKGDVIQAGQSRYYLVYYRDPTVLGGCPATSTFNATQTGRVDWSF